MPKTHDNSLVFLTMSAMMVIIVALTVMLLIDHANAKAAPAHKTEVVKSERSYPKIPKYLTTGTYLVHCRSVVKSYGVVQGTSEWCGSAFGIDLAEYGMPEHRYVITAAHVVMGEHAAPCDSFEIQIRTDKEKKWVKCKPLVVDRDRDLAVLECECDLPVVFQLADDEDVGNAVVVSGCPAGTVPSAVMGFLTSKDPEIPGTKVKCQIWQASAPFYSGNSGGPVLDAESQKVVAVLVAGLHTGEGIMVPNLAIIVPCTELRKLLDASFLLHDEPLLIVPSPVLPPAAPVVPPVKPPAVPAVPLPAPKPQEPKAEVVPLPPDKK